LKFGSEARVLKRKEEQLLEAAQMKFLKHLLEITKLDKEKYRKKKKKNGSTEHSKGNKTVPEKVATTCAKDGQRLAKQALQFQPKRRRNIERPRKRWRDQLHLEDQGTRNTPNPSGT
jgi:hypothetical protein